MAAASLTGSEEPLLHGEKAEKFGIIKVIATINLNYRFGRDLLGSNVATLGALLAIAAAVLLAIAEPGSTFYTDALWVRIAIPAGMAVLSVAIGLQLKRGGSCPMNLPMQKELGDKTVIITGANSGIGKVATEQFARWGAGKVIMACRNERRGEAAAADVRRATGCRPEQVEFSQCDTSDLGSVRAFVERLGDLRVDIVICNAGIMATPFAVNADGHELQYATNHLGHFLLINLLLPKLKEAPAPRVVIVSSTGHFLAPKRPNWRDTGDASVYHTWRACECRRTRAAHLTTAGSRSIAMQTVAPSSPTHSWPGSCRPATSTPSAQTRSPCRCTRAWSRPTWRRRCAALGRC